MADLYVKECEMADQMLRIQKALRSFESDAHNLNQLIQRIHKSEAVQSPDVESGLKEKADIVATAINLLQDAYASLEPTITDYLLELDQIDDLLE
ncbi:MAG: hypothetical protein IKF14_01550 [Atopobiaceae bacterium]|nr:hypothetical protein [Atopobiaceae bacterium]